jgi:hypothetical protein
MEYSEDLIKISEMQQNHGSWPDMHTCWMVHCSSSQYTKLLPLVNVYFSKASKYNESQQAKHVIKLIKLCYMYFISAVPCI